MNRLNFICHDSSSEIFTKCTEKHLQKRAPYNCFYASLREKCPYSQISWSVFYRIRTEYGEIRCISLYPVRTSENTNQKNFEYGHFSPNAFDDFIYKYRWPSYVSDFLKLKSTMSKIFFEDPYFTKKGASLKFQSKVTFPLKGFISTSQTLHPPPVSLTL